MDPRAWRVASVERNGVSFVHYPPTSEHEHTRIISFSGMTTEGVRDLKVHMSASVYDAQMWAQTIIHHPIEMSFMRYKRTTSSYTFTGFARAVLRSRWGNQQVEGKA